jgi:bifunctional non-homologous end joining protein LigD
VGEATALFDVLRPAVRRLLVRSRQPAWIAPMLATLTERRFSDRGWIFERKLDGERCLAFRDGEDVRLMSRNRLVVTNQFPEVVAAVASQPCGEFVIDGEIVAFDGDRTSFPRLQRRMHVHDPSPARLRQAPVVFVAFDLVHAVGHDVTAVPQRDRKALLRALLRGNRRRSRGALRYSEHVDSDGERFYREACSKGWEGLIAKRADAPYEPGRRSPSWLKFKCVLEQEFVIGGFTDPQGARTHLGALLVGYYDDGDLVYAGKVGTGFDRETLALLARELAPLERDRAPFTGPGLPRTRVHWTEPHLVSQIGFSEWTEDGQLRHPRFLGLRRDKDPRSVVRERPA